MRDWKMQDWNLRQNATKCKNKKRDWKPSIKNARLKKCETRKWSTKKKKKEKMQQKLREPFTRLGTADATKPNKDHI